MIDIPNISQTTAMGSNNSQIGLQYNYEECHNYGLSVADATAIAFAMLKEHYPQLRQELLDRLEELVAEKMEAISPAHIVPPTARIAVPTLQNASITEEEEIRQLYANLLVSSMNKDRKAVVHPAYIEIINQLSPDEAKILRYMYKHQRIPTITLEVIYKSGGREPAVKDFTNIPQKVGCENQQEHDSENYIDNLVRLGLITRSINSCLTNDEVYDQLKEDEYILDLKKKIEACCKSIPDFKCVEFQKGYVELTGFALRFCSICIGNPKG